MKAITAAICFLIPLTGFSQFCLPNGIIFSRQSQVDSFPLSYPGCILIEGDLHIEGDDILDIDSLYPIEAIKGNLRITYNPYLSGLVGFHSLRTIEKALSIIQNPKLKSLHGLTSLETVKEDFLINDNDYMTDLGGANNFHIVKGDLLISQNDSLVHPAGLRVDSIMGTLYLDENANMLDLVGLDSLTFIGGDLLIQNNSSLSNLSGINHLLYVGDHIELVNNSVLENISAVDQVQNTPWELLRIENCPGLSNCAIQSICNHLTADGNAIIVNNATGCNAVDEVKLACTAAIQNPLDKNEIVVYPNPTLGTFEIKNLHTNNFQCLLLKSDGRIIHSWNPGQASIDVSNLAPGLYVLKINGRDFTAVKVIVKN